jgi:glycosyltransferase involved in cell wall biosynthesis
MIKKYAFIVSKNPSEWVSCQSIVSNLSQAYQSILKKEEYQIFYLKHSANTFDCYQLSKNILEFRPLEIIYIDHKPSAASFINSLLSVYNKVALPQFTIHVYGDFTLTLEDWSRLEKDVTKLDIKFICASEKQKQLLSQLFTSDNKNLIDVTPFPVCQKTFIYNEKIRQEGRKKYSLTDDEFVFVYTGRISHQKNVTELIQSFLSMEKSLALQSKVRLILAGPFDDIGVPYLGLKTRQGSYQQKILGLLTLLDVNNSISYIGNLEVPDLQSLYNAGDCFVSISTHNDEDFGMSAAEALNCGLQVLLSDWAGYSSFYLGRSENGCDLVPVEFIEKKVIVNQSVLKKKMIIKVTEGKPDVSAREKLSKKSRDLYSTESVSSTLEKKLNTEKTQIQSFSLLWPRILATVTKNKMAPFRIEQGKYSDVYEMFYHPYWKQVDTNE